MGYRRTDEFGNVWDINDMGGSTLVSRGQTPANQPKNQDKLYTGAVKTQAADYSNIMNAYKNIANTNIQPIQFQYQRSPELNSAVTNLQNLSQNGGYSGEDIANLRARAISPIRAIYANANRDIDRKKALQGGYSPGYTSAKVKMARELSDRIGEATTNVNADIAGRVAQNKLSIAPTLASITGSENEFANNIGMRNADNLNDFARFIPQFKLSALDAMKSLYGTTPALASLFGSQALDAAQLANLVKNQDRQAGLQVIQQLMSRLA